jgi:hypothetical protein
MGLGELVVDRSNEREIFVAGGNFGRWLLRSALTGLLVEEYMGTAEGMALLAHTAPTPDNIKLFLSGAMLMMTDPKKRTPNSFLTNSMYGLLECLLQYQELLVITRLGMYAGRGIEARAAAARVVTNIPCLPLFLSR